MKRSCSFNSIPSLAAASALVLAATQAVYAQETPPNPSAELPPTASQPSNPPPKKALTELLPEALAKGKLLLNVRARYELAERDDLRTSHAPTIRTRLGYQTAPFYNFTLFGEFEDVRIIGNEDNFNQAGLSGPGKTPVADVEDTEVNQAWIAYDNWDSTFKLGRQRITLDNHRFVGNVGWRQNEQTYDAVSLLNTSLPDTALFYAYLDNVNRVFSDRHPAGNFRSDSHIINGAYSGIPGGTLTAYAYLLDFDNSALNSANTFGLFYAGSTTLNKENNSALEYRAEYAYQADAADNPIDYDAHYYNIELGGICRGYSVGAGYEVLTGDNGIGFSTPLATLHAFNGWADNFLTTPATGLRDFYAWFGCTLPGQIPFKFVYHKFHSDRTSTDFGQEYDAVISRKFAKNWTALLKYAYYDADGPFFDTQKFWAQVEFAF